MRETQFYICLAVTLGLLLLVIPVIFLLKKRLPTIQKKIFFAQVCLASMVVVLMPLYYHFYKVAMYYSMCLFIIALNLLCLYAIFSKENISNNIKINIHLYFLKINTAAIGSMLLFFMITSAIGYLSFHAANRDCFYDYQSIIFYITLFYPFFILATNIASSTEGNNPWKITIINSFIFITVYLPFFFFVFIDQSIWSIYKYLYFSYVPITLIIPSINLLLADRQNKTNKIIVLSSFLYLFISNIYFIFHEVYKYNDLEHFPTDITFSQFSHIGLLNLALIIPFLLMSYAIVFRNQTQPIQIGNEPANMS